MFSCCYIFFFFLINVLTFYCYSIQDWDSCDEQDVVLFDDEYYIAQNMCEQMSDPTKQSCRKCDLIVHFSPCLTQNGTLSENWCEKSIRCRSFRCSFHQYDALIRFRDMCVNNREAMTPCNQTQSVVNQCGVLLTRPVPSNDGSCIPMTSFGNIVKNSGRFPIHGIELDFFKNSSNIDSSADGPAYYRSHGNEENFGKSPWIEQTHTFISHCAMRLLDHSRFILLYFPTANLAVEIGHSNLTHSFVLTSATNSTILMCTPDTLSESFVRQLRPIVMVVGVTLSLLGLMFTAIISILLAEHRTVPGFNLLSLIASLFVAYFCAPIAVIHRETCPVIGVIHIYTILASVFWMNVVAFDIWQSLSTVQHLDQYRTSEHCIRLIRYSSYAWGVPSCLVIFGAVLDRLPGVPSNFRPGMVNGCWFSIKTTAATYLLYHGPIGLIMIANTVFFLLTARIVCQAQKQRLTTMRLADSHRYHFSLYVKLFLVMGLTWVMESLTGPIESKYYELVSDFVNTLQGFFIFFIFGCKMRVWRRIERCFGRRRGRLTIGATYASSYPSTSTFRSERDLSIKLSNNVRNSTTTVPLPHTDSSL